MKKKYFNHPVPYLLALIVTLIYFSLPFLANWIVSIPKYQKYARFDASRIVEITQSKFIPFGSLIDPSIRALLIFPFFLILFFGLRFFYLKTKKFWKYAVVGIGLTLLFLYIFPDTLLLLDNKQASITTGTIRTGKIKHAKRVPYRGENFTTFSFLGYVFGRTYAHDRARDLILDAYKVCEKTSPNTTYVLGEIGFRNGGLFIPHRTHQIGLSIDFMVPLLKNNRPYRSYHLFNLWGYGDEFDRKGKMGRATIDFEAMAQHILALKQQAKQNGLRIQRIIFDPVLQPYLFETSVGDKIKSLPFTKRRVIIRHDDHYHVDLAL